MKRKLSILSAILAATLALPAAALGNPPNGYSAHLGTSGWTVTAVDNPAPAPTTFYGSCVLQGPYYTWNESQSEVQILDKGVWRGLTWTVYVDRAPGKALWAKSTTVKTPSVALMTTLAPGDKFRTWAWGYVMDKSHHWQSAAAVSPTYTLP
jgi:hypothetical protein